MRCLSFLLLASPAFAQTRAPQPLRFDLTSLPVARDSFVFVVDGEERGFAVWQYEVRQAEGGEQVVYSQHSELQPLEEEDQRVLLNRTTGRPIAFDYHLEMFSPASDTILVEVDVEVKGGAIVGHRSTSTKTGRSETVPVNRPLPPGAVWASYELYAAAVTNASPGETLAVPAYRETHDSLVTLTIAAGQPTSIRVPAGRFDVLPLSSGDFRLYVTRVAPRRVVKGETSDGRFSFELAGSAAVVPTSP